jgi:two-component system cell cycle sensor histidine kinase/response regulator CckA
VTQKFQGVVVILNDITPLKSIGEERQNLHKQLLHAQKLESLGVLAGGIAHDFNNMLVGIMGYADLTLMHLPPASPIRHNVEQIIKTAVHASDLTKHLLAYSGKGKYIIQCLPLEDVVKEMEHLLTISISKSCVLKYDFAPNIPYIEADISQIQQIILNLVINASEAIGERSGVISISTGLIHTDTQYLNTTLHDDNLADGFYVSLEVSDTGCGMDEETRTRIFDPFFTTKFTGRGLGLSAVIGIVRGHRGAIKVYSEPGKGTSFKILLPIAESTLSDSKKAADTAEEWCGTGTALVVDDEETVREVAKMLLLEIGYAVITANDGREAIELYRKHKDEIAVVLLDLTMPHMDGTEAFTELRRINPDVKVILSSGYNETDTVNRFAGKGLAGFIQKPYRLNTLVDKLKEVALSK